jgi:hypothetical protein
VESSASPTSSAAAPSRGRRSRLLPAGDAVCARTPPMTERPPISSPP